MCEHMYVCVTRDVGSICKFVLGSPGRKEFLRHVVCQSSKEPRGPPGLMLYRAGKKRSQGLNSALGHSAVSKLIKVAVRLGWAGLVRELPEVGGSTYLLLPVPTVGKVRR